VCDWCCVRIRPRLGRPDRRQACPERLPWQAVEGAFDSNALVAELDEPGAKIVISPHPRRAASFPIDAEFYRWRHLIENFFCKLKAFKRIAMRSDKTDESFSALIYLAGPVINSR